MSRSYPIVVSTTCGHPTYAVVAFANGDLHRLFLACTFCIPSRVQLAVRCADQGKFVVEPVAAVAA